MRVDALKVCALDVPGLVDRPMRTLQTVTIRLAVAFSELSSAASCQFVLNNQGESLDAILDYSVAFDASQVNLDKLVLVDKGKRSTHLSLAEPYSKLTCRRSWTCFSEPRKLGPIS